MKAETLSVLMTIGMICAAFACLAPVARATDIYINNQTRIHLDSNNYPGGIVANWYYPGDVIAGWLEGRPLGGLPPPADGLEDILDVVVWPDDPLTPGCDAGIFANVVLQVNNVVLDPATGEGFFSFSGTSTFYMSDGPYCAYAAPSDYIEGVAAAPYLNRNIAFEIHEYNIQAATDRSGYIPGNKVSIFYLVSRINDGSPMTMTGYQSTWLVRSSDGLTYAYGFLTSSVGKFNFTINNIGGITPPEAYPVNIWFNSTSGGAARRASLTLNVRVGNLDCAIGQPTGGSQYAPGSVLEIDVAVVVSVPLGGSDDYAGASVLIKILDGGLPTSPEITAYTKTYTSDGAGQVMYALVLDPAVFLDGNTYTVLANATSILHYASDSVQFTVRRTYDTISVRVILDKDSYYSGETAVVNVAAQPPPGHTQPNTFVYMVYDTSGAVMAVESTSSSTYNFSIPPNFQGSLTFGADVYNSEGDHGYDAGLTHVSFGVLIVNTNPFRYSANDVITVSFELKSTVMTGSTTLFHYSIYDGSRYVEEGSVNTGGSLFGSLQYTVPNGPQQGYDFTIYASGGGHVVSGSGYAEWGEGFILSISLDKQSYLPGETMAVSYSLASGNPSVPLLRVCQFVYGLLGGSNAVLFTSETSGTFDYPISPNVNEGIAIFQVAEGYTSTVAYEIVQIGTSSSPEVPTAPRNLQATAGYHVITLTWSPPTSDGGAQVTGYRIYRGTTTGGETLLASVGNTTSYADSGLTAGQAYYYKVTAVNAGGEGPMSSEVSATPSAPPSEVGTGEGPVNGSMSLVLLVLALVILIVSVALSIVNLRKMRGNAEKKQTEEVREPERRQE